MMRKNNHENHMAQAINRLFKKLDALDIKYCVLHSYETLPSKAESDIDTVIDYNGMRQMDEVLNEVSEALGWKIIQRMQHEHTACNYIMTYINNGEISFLSLDFCTDYIRNGAILFKADELLEGRREYKGFYISSPLTEGVYILLKKILKKHMNTSQVERVQEIYNEDSDGFEALLKRFFDDETLQEIKDLIVKGNTEEFNKKILTFRKRLLWRYYTGHPHQVAKYLVRDSARVLQRILHPTGFVIALLGPDGSGKSSVSKGVTEIMENGFRRSMCLHWRPSLFPMAGEFVGKRGHATDDFTQPHKKPPYGFPLSFLRFFYYSIDYILGYYLKIFPAKVRSTLVVFDRYYFDFLVDRSRYRMNLPEWIPLIFLKIVPKPDLTIYLDAPPEILKSRKQELSEEELERQFNTFNTLLPKIKNGQRVDAKSPLNEVVTSICLLISDKLERRYNPSDNCQEGIE